MISGLRKKRRLRNDCEHSRFGRSGARKRVGGTAGIEPKIKLMLCAIGHSLGAAVRWILARVQVERVILIAPFTTLREEAATLVGGWVSRLLIESYDNRAKPR